MSLSNIHLLKEKYDVSFRSLEIWTDQGLIKGAELCLNPYFFWLAGEVSWLAVEALSPCQI